MEILGANIPGIWSCMGETNRAKRHGWGVDVQAGKQTGGGLMCPREGVRPAVSASWVSVRVPFASVSAMRKTSLFDGAVKQ